MKSVCQRAQTKSTNAPVSSHLPGPSHNFGHARGGTVNAHRSSPIQQRSGKHPSSRESQHGVPSSRPRGSGSRKRSKTPRVLAHDRSLTNCRFSREAASDLTCEHDKLLSASSVCVVPLSRRACLRAIPLTSCALGRDVPSRRIGLTSLVSTANWAPLNRVSPSTTTSNRLLSMTIPTPRSNSQENVCPHLSTCFLTDAGRCGLQRKSPTPENPSNCACRPVVAQVVEETTTCTNAQSKGAGGATCGATGFGMAACRSDTSDQKGTP